MNNEKNSVFKEEEQRQKRITRMRTYRKNNRDKIREYAKKWNIEHKEQIRYYMRYYMKNYYALHKDKWKNYQKKSLT